MYRTGIRQLQRGQKFKSGLVLWGMTFVFVFFKERGGGGDCSGHFGGVTCVGINVSIFFEMPMIWVTHCLHSFCTQVIISDFTVRRLVSDPHGVT